MKRSVELSIALSEARTALNGLETAGGEDDVHRAKVAEARAKLVDLDADYREALRVEAEAEDKAADAERDGAAEDAEAREKRELRSKARLGNWLLAASMGRTINGAEAEYAAAEGLNDGAIPFALFETEPKAETRADAPTASPATVGVNMDAIVPAVFSESIAAQLAIDMPMVESGTYALPAITASLTASMEGKGDAVDSTAATIGVSTTTPHRLSGRMSIRLEDRAAIGAGDFEASLRENLRMVLAVALDNQIFNGDGTGDNINGLLKRLTDPAAPTAQLNFANGVAALAELVDGLWAMSTRDVRQVVGVETYRRMASTFQAPTVNGSNGELALASYIAEHGAGLRTNARMPAKNGKNQTAIAVRTGRPGVRTAVLPTWGSVSIDDIYSGSAKAENYFTVHALIGDLVLAQAGAYTELNYQLDA